MAQRGRKNLSEEDHKTWSRFSRTVKPLPRMKPDPVAETPLSAAKTVDVPKPPKKPPLPAPQKTPERAATPQSAKHPIDDRTRRKIARGRVSLDDRIDLHGMTHDRAKTTLTAFLVRCHRAGDRTVLVITGKGSVGEGVLRNALPRWLATEPLAAMVSGYTAADRKHGGEGAFYVRLKRLPGN